MLYAHEKQLALRIAEKQASELFNICPICGKPVCDRCFMICADMDMCKSCVEKLNEVGEPVQKTGTGENSRSF